MLSWCVSLATTYTLSLESVAGSHVNASYMATSSMPESATHVLMSSRHVIWLTVSTVLVTVVFYYILMILDTPNIVFSTISIVTSFLAAALTMLRSSYYAVGYAANDVVLIVLWVLASFENPAYIPVVVNFVIFFANDMYGFVSWKKREVRQAVDM